MKFTKMHGIGNDYIYVEHRDWEAAGSPKKPVLVQRLSDRHFGIGGDGVIFINPSETADFEMEMYNADGSRAEMCGNGIRCVGKYVYDHGLTDQTEITVESMGKVKVLELHLVDPDKADKMGSRTANSEKGRRTVDTVTVDMGVPEILEEEFTLEIQGRNYSMTSVSTGNPHAVTFVEDTDSFPVCELGPRFENHPHFPNRTNTEFIQVLDRKSLKMRVWERGTGETLACGTGACASAAAAVLKGLCDREVTIHLLGGDLQIRLDEESGHVFMTGEAREAFSGEVEV